MNKYTHDKAENAIKELKDKYININTDIITKILSSDSDDDIRRLATYISSIKYMDDYYSFSDNEIKSITKNLNAKFDEYLKRCNIIEEFTGISSTHKHEESFNYNKRYELLSYSGAEDGLRSSLKNAVIIKVNIVGKEFSGDMIYKIYKICRNTNGNLVKPEDGDDSVVISVKNSIAWNSFIDNIIQQKINDAYVLITNR